MLRQIHLILTLINTKEGEPYDLFIVDQLSIGIPFIREYFPNARILFYGHFPDKLLADHSSLLKKAYRYPFDFLEQWSTGLSDVIVVNSKFTQSVFHEAFPKIKNRLGVLYPCVNTSQIKNYVPSPFAPKSFALSINRFEKKKNIELAISAFHLALKGIPSSDSKKYKLIIAGGYDFRVTENQTYMAELQALCGRLNLSYATIWPSDGLSAYSTPSIQSKTVIFIPSVGDDMKKSLLADAALLTYTPWNEHFGIVPLEAMLAGTPVIATNSGGPLETITSETGWHRPPKAEEWAPVLKHALHDITPAKRTEFEKNCQNLVLSRFSEKEMALEFQKYGQIAMSTKRTQEYSFKAIESIAILVTIVVIFLIFLIVKLR